MKNVRLYSAVLTPMSRTRPARSPNSSTSWSWRPNSLTSIAPATPKRSVMVVFMDAFRSICSRVRSWSRRPTRLAGMTKTGRTTRDRRVNLHSR